MNRDHSLLTTSLLEAGEDRKEFSVLPGPFLNWPWEALVKGAQAFQPCVGSRILPPQPLHPTGRAWCLWDWCSFSSWVLGVAQEETSSNVEYSINNIVCWCQSMYLKCVLCYTSPQCVYCACVFMSVCLLGTQDAYTLTCGRSSQLKKKQQNANASSWLGNHHVYWFIVYFHW